MTCSHLLFDYMPPYFGGPMTLTSPTKYIVYKHVCSSCGEWLPLGPATITPEVEIEIRAAELARYADWIGWNYLGQRAYYTDVSYAVESDTWPEYQAGYLAAAILDEEG